MIFKLHYWFLAAGANALGILLGVYIQEYTDANAIEIGALYMLMPFTGLIFRPIICSKADREQAHQKYLIGCLFFVAASYAPFVIIPILGPEVYREYPRVCWYILVTLKVLGDIAFGGVISIGDALAINYAKRIGTQFSVYRVWGTISWMVFGIVIGQVNEIPHLPKYVPGFIILISSSLLDMTIVWLWPKDYFTMIPESEIKKNEEKRSGEENAFMKSLLPRDVVMAHMKRKIISFFTCSEIAPDPELENKTRRYTSVGIKTEIDKSEVLDRPSKSDATGKAIVADSSQRQTIDKKTQVRILFLLLRRDPRIILYLLYFVAAGVNVGSIGFLFMGISERCHDENSCDFSQLGGLLQVSMALYETVIFIFIKRIQESLGRLNTGALAFFLYSIKMLFYATIWPNVNPYWSLVFEGFHGAAFGIYLTMMAELGYKFSNEVEYILPELQEKNIIDKESDGEHLKLALTSTMQSLIASAMDGIGRGFASLVFGCILHHFAYDVLWRVICGLTYLFILVTLTINLIDYLFKFEFGLDVAAEKMKKKPIYSEGSNKIDPAKDSTNHVEA